MKYIRKFLELYALCFVFALGLNLIFIDVDIHDGVPSILRVLKEAAKYSFLFVVMFECLDGLIDALFKVDAGNSGGQAHQDVTSGD